MIEVAIAIATVFAVMVVVQVGPWYLAVYGVLIVAIGLWKGLGADDDDRRQD